jgi:LacI family gluconate utilization system Gnt-I transcriptional repressor
LADRASAAGGAQGLAELIAAHPDVDAVFCANDMLALGCLFEVRRRGWAVPERLKLCGFGDLEFAAASEPSLTTIRPPRREIGTRVAELLRARLDGAPEEDRVFDLGFDLVVRAST